MNDVSTPSAPPGEEVIILIAGSQNTKKRLDVFITSIISSRISRSRIKMLIRQGKVCINGSTIREPDYQLKDMDRIHLCIPEPDPPTPQPENIPLDIIFEDDSVIVIDKPAGMVTHPGAGNGSSTLVNALLYHCRDSLAGIGGVRRLGIVHRLDKDTSGVMVAAKTDAAHNNLCAQFADHGKSGPLERAYLALVWGKPERSSGSIDVPLGRSTHNRLKRAVAAINGPGSRHATTHYRVLQSFGGEKYERVSLIECRLETGRTHQIRVHMSHIGHPLLGDRDYGNHFQTKTNRISPQAKTALNRLDRQALHAKLLGFEHPVTCQPMKFEVPLPADLKALLETLS